ncbi:MAG TPA: copper resistance protein B [Vicinamibacterales bacterium]|nr:copper resistance protein B [Vicinamibacterales bacterium]
MSRHLLVVLLLALPSLAAAQPPDPHAGHVMPAAPAQPGNQSPPEITAVPPITDADRAAAFPDVHGHTVHDNTWNYKVLFDQLEWQYIHGAQGLRWDNKSWVGGDLNRIWVKTEGEAVDGVVDDAEVQLLYARSFSRWWDLVGGVRHDFRPSPQHTWFAFGIQGLAPQWFEVELTGYVGSTGHTAARVEVEYEMLLTNRLVLQPLIELSFAGKDDPDRGIGAGLSTGEVGFRLRYEIRRELAPYFGVVWHRKLFGTADFASAEGRDIGGWHIVSGLRTWF